MTGPRHRPDSAGEPPTGTESILYVDDETAVRVLARKFLESLGYDVLEAPDGRSALELAAGIERPIDLLITDVLMPHVGGRELAERLRGDCAGLRVLFVSGDSGDDLLQRGIPGAEFSFLKKPFTLAALARKVRDVLDTGRPAG